MFTDEDSSPPEDNWMDTYADAITLLMAFFVVLLAMSSMDAKKYEHMREALSEGVNKSPLEQVSKPFEAQAEQSNQFSLIRPIPSLDQYSYLATLYGRRADGFGKEIFFHRFDLCSKFNHSKNDAEPIVSSVANHS